MATTQTNISKRFTVWEKWHDRDELPGIKYPGIYAIAYSDNDLSKSDFSWRKEIIYVGMTNSLSGLKGRLKQFDNTIVGKTGHGGADRVRYKYPDYNALVPKLYVSVAAFECSPEKATSKDLLIMGDVEKFEYECFAHFQDIFGRLPEFNDKKHSPKHSKKRKTKSGTEVS